jgi:excisionase family DNA binding protein
MPIEGWRSDAYLRVEDVALMLHCSTRTIHELTRTRAIPHVKRPHGRRCLFRYGWLQAWLRGAALIVIDLPFGGRVVRPRDTGDASLPNGSEQGEEKYRG